MHGGAFSTMRLMHNGGLCNVWLCIMRLMHDEGMIDASSQSRFVQICLQEWRFLAQRTSKAVVRCLRLHSFYLLRVYMCFPATCLLGVREMCQA